jgi:hypothetical protein
MVEKVRYLLRKVKKRWVALCFGLFVLAAVAALGLVEHKRVQVTTLMFNSNMKQTEEILSLVEDYQAGAANLYDLVYQQATRIRDLESKMEQLEGRVYPTVEELTGIILVMNPKVPPVRAMEIATSVRNWSKHYNLPPILVLSLIKRESQFNPKADSGTGAKGLMQVIAYWHKEKLEKFGMKKEDLFNINENIGVGCWILREYLDRSGSIDGALRRYVGSDHRGYIIDILSGYTDYRMRRISLVKQEGAYVHNDPASQRRGWPMLGSNRD